MTMIDPLDDHAEEAGRGGVPRDRSGRALLKMRGTEIRVPYTAASSLSDYISETYALRRWERRYLARGMGLRTDLAGLAAAETYSTGFAEDDDRENKSSGRRLDDIIDRALDTARVHERADWGTAVHQLTEPRTRALGGRAYSEAMQRDVDAFWRSVRGVAILGTEVFVANDELMAAGTFDHVLDGDHEPFRHEVLQRTGIDVAGTVVIDDKKTGKIKAPETSVQMAVYAGGEIYDAETETRRTFEEVYGKPANRQVGIFHHVPAQEARAQMYPLDLVAGRQAAEHAIWVRDWQRKSLALGEPLDDTLMTREHVVKLITHSTSIAMLTEIWNDYQDVWNEILTGAAELTISRKGLV